MIKINPTKILIGGDKSKAKYFIGPAKSQLEILKNQMTFQNLSQNVRKLWLTPDVYIECRKIYNYQECRVWVRPIEAIEAKEISIITDYILIISSQSEEEAFAWNLLDNTILTDELDNPMTVDTLTNVKKFVLEYIIRNESDVEVLSNSDIDPIQLTISDSYYESWWKMESSETPNCAAYTGYDDIDTWNATVSVWPEYNQIDYSKKTLSDCVNEENTKVSKIHHPVYYEGVITGYDPDFDGPDFTTPNLTVFQATGTDTPLAEWMTPYIEYTNHETGIEEEQESSGIIKKFGRYIPSNVPENIKITRCGLDDDPYEGEIFAAYERIFYWFASIFSTNIHTYDDTILGETNIVATQTTLDTYIDFLYDTWDEDCHGVTDYIPERDDYGCVSASVPFSDFGVAKNNKGAVVFDFCTVAWGYSKDSLTADQKYRGAVSNDYSQIFRLYSHQVGSLTGYALEIFNAHNDIRDSEGLNKFSSNIHLSEAAQRHADDLALHGMTGHMGSDGSTFDERIEDTDYFLWVYDYYYTGENVNNVDMNESDVVATAMDEWIASPTHWANMISEDYDEIGIGVATGTYLGVPFIWFVVNFGSIKNKWPGFAQVDTTEILTYMNTNFSWSGTEDHIRVPKLFLV